MAGVVRTVWYHDVLCGTMVWYCVLLCSAMVGAHCLQERARHRKEAYVQSGTA